MSDSSESGASGEENDFPEVNLKPNSIVEGMRVYSNTYKSVKNYQFGKLYSPRTQGYTAY